MEKTNLLKGRKTQTIVIQPTPFCNIDCRYCYLSERSSPQKMNLKTLSRIFERVFAFDLLDDEITLIWHAGEPLVVPLDFYEQAFQHIDQLNAQRRRVKSVIQTNGTLITQEWCDFSKRRKIQINVSLDGPKRLHDRARVDRAGKGTFERAMRGIKLLQENGMAPSILMVLTSEALDAPDEIWEFFREEQLHRLILNVEEINGINKKASLEIERDKERYKRFLKRLLELREASDSALNVREIEAPIKRIRELTRPVFAPENIPGAILSFDYAGNVSTFASELLGVQHPRYGNFLLGNVFEASLEELLSRQKLIEMDAEIQRGVARCKKQCAYFMFCGGGSPVNKLSEHGTFDATETMHCQFRIQATMDVILEYLEGQEDLSRYVMV